MVTTYFWWEYSFFLIYAVTPPFKKRKIRRKTRTGYTQTKTDKLHGENEHREVLNNTLKYYFKTEMAL
jgi:hypothetical protein